jgi:Selenocysteine lyase
MSKNNDRSSVDGVTMLGALKYPSSCASSAELLNLKSRFPIFAELPEVVFLDNASTTQKPDTVIDTIENFYRRQCANAGRAMYSSSLLASQSIERARHDIARLINACPSEVAFTSGATDSLNAVAWSWGLANLKDGDEVLICFQDHSSAVSPWIELQSTLARLAVNIHIVPFQIHAVGDYDLKSIKQAVTDRTRLIAIAHIHHVFGLEMEVPEIREIVGDDVVITVDASQSIGHTKVDVESLTADFLSFSGHKMFAGNGVGVLFAKKERHAEIISFRSGGRMSSIGTDIDDQSRNRFINKIESGTANIPSIASLSASVEFIESIGIKDIREHVSELTKYLVEGLSSLPGIVFGPGPVTCGCPGGFGIVSFNFEFASSFDVAAALANENIHVRSGAHCRADHASSDDLIRVSLQVYNTRSDVDILVQTLEELLG